MKSLISAGKLYLARSNVASCLFGEIDAVFRLFLYTTLFLAPIVGRADIDPDLRSLLSPVTVAGWSLTVSSGVAKLEREKEVFLIPWLSRPMAFSKPAELVAHGFGKRARYVITLTFVPRLGDEAVKGLFLERQKYLELLDRGALTKDEYSDALHGYWKCQVPDYHTESFSVFVDRVHERFVEISPIEDAAEIRSVVASLSRVLTPYEFQNSKIKR